VATLLRVRRQMEDLRAMELAAAVRAFENAREQRDRIAAALRENMMERAVAQRQRFHPAAMRHRAQYERHLAQMLDAAESALMEREQEVKARREALLEASRNRKVMEKLDEKVNRMLMADLLWRERRELDDLSAARRGIRRDTGSLADAREE